MKYYFRDFFFFNPLSPLLEVGDLSSLFSVFFFLAFHPLFSCLFLNFGSSRSFSMFITLFALSNPTALREGEAGKTEFATLH